ncbi:IS701 family transposase [Streptomyces flaveolus]|uniref:IS701 family transposase n=1 Tax=Streptomyces flaveolus TaxID=67297 RepID=UPI003F5422BE
MARIAGRFGRVEPRATARAYLLGLLSATERKNCWQLAEQAGLARPGPMQRLLRYARWDADAVRDDVRAYVVDHLGDDGVLIVDETGFVKKGSMSAGVQRQYTGTAGRIENSQVGVFLAYATERGRALIDRRLYLPEHSWCSDPGRRHAAGVPEDLPFATKPHLAGEMIAAALDAGVSASWVTGDEAYGQDPQLRARLERTGIGYVMAVTCSTRVRINQGRTPVRADVLADRLPASARQRHSAGAGAKGPRYNDWAWIHIGTGGVCLAGGEGDTVAVTDGGQDEDPAAVRASRATQALAVHRDRPPPQPYPLGTGGRPVGPALFALGAAFGHHRLRPVGVCGQQGPKVFVTGRADLTGIEPPQDAAQGLLTRHPVAAEEWVAGQAEGSQFLRRRTPAPLRRRGDRVVVGGCHRTDHQGQQRGEPVPHSAKPLSDR